jgi:hypothetical protein
MWVHFAGGIHKRVAMQLPCAPSVVDVTFM